MKTRLGYKDGNAGMVGQSPTVLVEGEEAKRDLALDTTILDVVGQVC